MKAMNDHIAYILATLIDTSVRTNNQDKKITVISSKLSTYEDILDKIKHKETQLQTLALQVKNDKNEKIIELSSKISTYENCLEKMSNKETQIQPFALQLKQ